MSVLLRMSVHADWSWGPVRKTNRAKSLKKKRTFGSSDKTSFEEVIILGSNKQDFCERTSWGIRRGLSTRDEYP